MKALNVISYLAFTAAIIALPFMLVNWWKYMRSPRARRLGAFQPGFPYKSISFFVFSALTAIAAASVMTAYARHDVLNFIQNLSGNYTVYVNQKQVREAEKIISSLKEIAPYSAHHSHPTTRIRVDIHTDARDITLELGRDSGNPKEYWVFYSEYSVTSNNEIGRITTSAFDDY